MLRASDLALIAVADSGVLTGRSITDACVAAESGGATSIQLRMKNAPASLFLETAESVLKSVSIPVFINDRVDVAILAGAAGVHLGTDDIGVDEARKLPGADGLIFGTSVGNLAEAESAQAHDVEYWGCGPVFATGNKPDAGKPIGPEGLKQLVDQAAGVPVVGIGGIDSGNCGRVLASGAIGVAVIGAIFDQLDIEAAARELRNAVDGVLRAG